MGAEQVAERSFGDEQVRVDGCLPAISPIRAELGAAGAGCWHESSLGLSMQASEV
jgi:hypothetical protein